MASEESDGNTGAGVIRFLCSPGLVDVLPEPQPARRLLPAWFKDLPHTLGEGNTAIEGLRLPKFMTMKACMPVNDAFSLGWMLVLPADVEVTCDEVTGNARFNWDPAYPLDLVTRHHPAQVGAPAPPFDGVQVHKWMNPWRIVTPPGWSVLLTQPLNHLELPFRLVSGVVDTDRFAPLINLPFVWTGGPGSFTLERGSPLAQVIPFQRQPVLSRTEIRAADPVEQEELDAATRRKHKGESVYTREWRDAVSRRGKPQ